MERIVTYAQNGEDVILRRLFEGKDKGFYIDIGANHPVNLSTTKYFFDLGWRGINVEPIRKLHNLFVKERPFDLNLNVAIGEENKSHEFFEVATFHELSTFSSELASKLARNGYQINSHRVKTITGDTLFSQYVNEPVDFLKIDVEGWEHVVIHSINFIKWRPKVILVEATTPGVPFPGWNNLINIETSSKWEGHILKNGYIFAYFDGLNKFYVNKEFSHFLDCFRVGLCLWDNFIQYPHNKYALELEEKEVAIQNLFILIKNKYIELEEKKRMIQEQALTLSLINRTSYIGLAFIKVIKALHLNFFLKYLNLIVRHLKPKIGKLNQHSPRLLRILKPPPSLEKPEPQLKISIVTPSFNQGMFIEKTIKSILDQEYLNLEYIIQDAGSTDETLDILKRYDSKLSDWTSAPDSGQSQAINLGFSKTTGDIMCWLNSDDILLPGALDCVINYFNQHPEVDVVYGNRLLIDENDMEIGSWILPGHDANVLTWVDYIPQETLFWRRNIWDKVGGYIDESFSFAMDWDLLIRFRDAGACFAHIPFFLGGFRVHKNQKTSSEIEDFVLLKWIVFANAF